MIGETINSFDLGTAHQVFSFKQVVLQQRKMMQWDLLLDLLDSTEVAGSDIFAAHFLW